MGRSVGRDRTSLTRARKPSAGTAASSQPETLGRAWASCPASDNATAAVMTRIGDRPIGTPPRSPRAGRAARRRDRPAGGAPPPGGERAPRGGAPPPPRGRGKGERRVPPAVASGGAPVVAGTPGWVNQFAGHASHRPVHSPV